MIFVVEKVSFKTLYKNQRLFFAFVCEVAFSAAHGRYPTDSVKNTEVLKNFDSRIEVNWNNSNNIVI